MHGQKNIKKGDTASLMLSIGARGERVVNATSRPLCPWERNPVPSVRGRWVCPRSSLEGYGEYKSLVYTGVRTGNRPAGNESLY